MPRLVKCWCMQQNVLQPSSLISAGRNLSSNVPLGWIPCFHSCSREQWWGTEWSWPQLTPPAASPSCHCSLPIPSIDQADVIWITGHAHFFLPVHLIDWQMARNCWENCRGGGISFHFLNFLPPPFQFVVCAFRQQNWVKSLPSCSLCRWEEFVVCLGMLFAPLLCSFPFLAAVWTEKPYQFTGLLSGFGSEMVFLCLGWDGREYY